MKLLAIGVGSILVAVGVWEMVVGDLLGLWDVAGWWMLVVVAFPAFIAFAAWRGWDYPNYLD